MTDADIAAYYEKHKTLFKQPTSVDVDYVVLKPSDIQVESLAVTEAELQEAYTAFVATQNRQLNQM